MKMISYYSTTGFATDKTKPQISFEVDNLDRRVLTCRLVLLVTDPVTARLCKEVEWAARFTSEALSSKLVHVSGKIWMVE
jgi:hypothetical protein